MSLGRACGASNGAWRSWPQWLDPKRGSSTGIECWRLRPHATPTGVTHRDVVPLQGPQGVRISTGVDAPHVCLEHRAVACVGREGCMWLPGFPRLPEGPQALRTSPSEHRFMHGSQSWRVFCRKQGECCLNQPPSGTEACSPSLPSSLDPTRKLCACIISCSRTAFMSATGRNCVAQGKGCPLSAAECELTALGPQLQSKAQAGATATTNVAGPTSSAQHRQFSTMNLST